MSSTLSPDDTQPCSAPFIELDPSELIADDPRGIKLGPSGLLAGTSRWVPREPVTCFDVNRDGRLTERV